MTLARQRPLCKVLRSSTTTSLGSTRILNEFSHGDQLIINHERARIFKRLQYMDLTLYPRRIRSSALHNGLISIDLQ
jgi:hypothetical protein